MEGLDFLMGRARDGRGREEGTTADPSASPQDDRAVVLWPPMKRGAVLRPSMKRGAVLWPPMKRDVVLWPPMKRDAVLQPSMMRDCKGFDTTSPYDRAVVL